MADSMEILGRRVRINEGKNSQRLNVIVTQLLS